MSSYVFMKVLERVPSVYDRGMRLMSRGRVAEVHKALARAVASPEREVLDIGCGTGGVTIACAQAGARVVGIDLNPEMLEVAQRRVDDKGLGARVQLLAMGAAELEDHFDVERFDGVVSCLAFSEMAPAEQRYCLATARSRLRPGGLLALADEVRPDSAADRLRRNIVRAPLAAATWLLAQASTQALDDLPGLLRESGFDVDSERGLGLGFAMVLAHRPPRGTT